MEQPKRENFTKNLQRLDELARKGHFKKGDEPGTDTYDDGMNEKGEVIMPGSTSTESGGTYMEDKGPRDMRHRNEEGQVHTAEGWLTVADRKEVLKKEDLYAGDDPAARWLRENDPNYKGNDELREAA